MKVRYPRIDFDGVFPHWAPHLGVCAFQQRLLDHAVLPGTLYDQGVPARETAAGSDEEGHAPYPLAFYNPANKPPPRGLEQVLEQFDPGARFGRPIRT
ncbi:hypothetical protein [uncultured Sphingomonas sp.]|uniref:hypothetical protein n=1 Tax=uncultured Sphingomonas sp. TaxID=158754 RepID=UPI0035CBE7C4